MPIALEVTLILVLAALAIGLVPLLFQLRRTAQGMDAFLLASRRDLAQIAEDVHASRLRIDHLADALQPCLVEVSAFSHAMGDLGRTVKDLHGRFQSTLELASRSLGGVIGGISAALALFKGR